MSAALETALKSLRTVPRDAGTTLWVVLGNVTRNRIGVFISEEAANQYCAERNMEVGRFCYTVEARFFPRSVQ